MRPYLLSLSAAMVSDYARASCSAGAHAWWSVLVHNDSESLCFWYTRIHWPGARVPALPLLLRGSMALFAAAFMSRVK